MLDGEIGEIDRLLTGAASHVENPARLRQAGQQVKRAPGGSALAGTLARKILVDAEEYFAKTAAVVWCRVRILPEVGLYSSL
jgi:hypothetical protein